jgi:integrase
VKWGCYYGRFRTVDGRRVNRRLGPVRQRGSSDGLTKSQAEAALRRLIEAENAPKPPRENEPAKTVDEVVDLLRERLEIQGARLSYRQNCESMQRIHITPVLGRRRIDTVERADVEGLIQLMLRRGLAPKTVRNVATFLSSAFALAVDRGWIETYPVARAARPKRRRGDASPDLRYLTIAQLDAVLAEIPDIPVVRDPAPTRRGRRGTAPPPPPDVLGPVLRVLILAAAVTGLRQPELLGLHWRDVDWDSQRIRVRNAYVRGEHSAEGKPDLSTRRSGPDDRRAPIRARALARPDGLHPRR